MAAFKGVKQTRSCFANLNVFKSTLSSYKNAAPLIYFNARKCFNQSKMHEKMEVSRAFDTNTLIGPAEPEVAERVGEPRKILRVGILGEPNAGKSSFINSIVGEKVSITSEVMNTTREGIFVPYQRGNTQMVFIDTPGIVPFQEARRLKLGRKQITAPRRIIDECDVVAVMADLGTRRRRERIHECILDLLNKHPDFPCILVLNKIDLIKRKSTLLKFVSNLTTDRKKDVWGYEKIGGYSGFKDIFMISALNGDGVKDIENYLMQLANEGDWLYEDYVKVDMPLDKQISELFRETLLEMFQHEIPWQVKQMTLLFEETGNDSCRIHHKLIWPKKSQARFVRTKAEEITTKTHEKLIEILQKNIHLKVDISSSASLARNLPF